MKKSLLCILALAMTLVITGCGSSDDVNDKSPVGESTNDSVTKAPANKTADVNIEEQVIYDVNNIKVTATKLNADGIFGPELDVLIENNSDNNITVQSDKSSINGIMVDTLFSADVAAHKKINDSITFSSTTIDNASITTFKTIEFVLKILDPDTYDDIATTDIITIDTDADSSYVQAIDDSGFVAYDADNIKVVVKKLSSSDSFWGSDLYLYIENNTKKNVTIQAEDVSIDGFMIDPLFSADVLAGKKAFDVMTFMESDLTDNGVEDITSLDFKLNIFETDTWEDIIKTDIIKVNFEK